MSFYIFDIKYKLSRKQFNIIIKKLQLYCDKIKCDKFDIHIWKNERKKLYSLNINLYDNEVDESNTVIELVKFYLDAFDNDEKIF